MRGARFSRGTFYSLLATAWAVTRLDITGTINANVTFSVNSSGVNYTKSRDDGNLGVDAAEFLSDARIEILPNGLGTRKGVDVVWISVTSFQISKKFYNGDFITIKSKT